MKKPVHDKFKFTVRCVSCLLIVKGIDESFNEGNDWFFSQIFT